MKSGTLTKVTKRVHKSMKKTYRGKRAQKAIIMPGGRLMRDSYIRGRRSVAVRKRKTTQEKAGVLNVKRDL